MAHEFNLIDEPWIIVRTQDCTLQTVSLKTAILHAHEYICLSGELPTQDIAVLRLLLAVLHTVFSRVNENGEPAQILNEDDALDRWEALWKLGTFPQKPIEAYLTEWKDRFWLFDEKYPFWQVASLEVGTEYGAAKLNGTISESNHKIRLFPNRTAQAKGSLNFDEAARWILCLNAFDDASVKVKTYEKNTAPSIGVGWLGKIGSVCAIGNNLYETLMLNLVLLKNGTEVWDAECVPAGKNCPAWELERPRSDERTKIPLPNHPAALLTLQSRRILLHKQGDVVTGYLALGGDFFPPENAVSEQMTLWADRSDEKEGITIWSPRRHDPARQMWRDFSSLVSKVSKNTDDRRPGVVNWIAHLRENRILSKTETIHFSVMAVVYDTKQSTITDAFGDELSFHIDLLTDLGRVWNKKIEEEIQKCDEVAGYIASLVVHLRKAAGDSGNISTASAKAAFYAAVDTPFRQWLQSLSPSQPPQEQDERILQWRETAEEIAKAMAQEQINAAGPAAFVGRTVEEGRKGKKIERHYSAPEAMNLFQYRMKNLYHQEVNA